MKLSTIAIAAVAALTVGTAYTGTASAESELQKLHEVQRDNRDIRHDNRDIHADKRDLRQDKGKLAHDRAERNYDQMREERAIEHGNLRGAEKWDSRRRAEQREIHEDKRDIHQDSSDLN